MSLRVFVADHQRKSLRLASALAAAGCALVDDPSVADATLIDHDVPFHGKLPLAEACVANGGRAFMYPHGGNASLMAVWDGLSPTSPLLSGALVTGPGHVEVARRYGYAHPVYPIGWTLCELRPRRRTARVETVLLAPEHDAPTTDRNRDVFEQLLRRGGVKIVVRHVGTLEENGLRRVPGVEYVRVTLSDLDSCIAQIDAADVVVASTGTFPSLAVARGVTTVMWGTRNLLNDARDAEAANAELYRDLVRFPFDADDADVWDLIDAASADEDAVGDWRHKFVGGPLDVEAVLEALTTAPRRRAVPAGAAPLGRYLHRVALQELAAGRPQLADDLLTRAVRESVDLELVNDLAVMRIGLGRSQEAEQLLRASLALDPTRHDARANLEALMHRLAAA